MALSATWYHDFSVLGLPTAQKEGIFGPNQKAKQGPLFELIRNAVARDSGACVELFCADAFFGIYALQQGAASLLGIDAGVPGAGGLPIHLEQARIAADVLGVGDRARFEARDVWDLQGEYSSGICAGGLYHVRDPAGLLKRLRAHVKTSLVVQTVFSLSEPSPDYFEIAPRVRPHGCRFSRAWITNAVVDSGWKILIDSANELPGNDDPGDRGSLYLLLA